MHRGRYPPYHGHCPPYHGHYPPYHGHYTPHDGYMAAQAWSRFRTRYVYRSTEVRGLGNYGLTCCVNALLQSFSATSELEYILHKWDASSVREEAANVPLQLKRLLGDKWGDTAQPAPHRDFLRCLDRQHIRLNIQHDADQVFLAILDFMQQQMDDPALVLEVQSLYRIYVELHLQCLRCSHTEGQTSYLLSLPLHLREDHSNTLEECMASFFELQELRGIDSCFCAQCRTHTPAKQGFKLLSLPTILCMQLQRFRKTYKLDCYLKFPESFDLKEILRQDMFSRDFQNDGRTTYSLFAVIVHSGYAMFGHYTAFVRTAPGHDWFYADDSHVERVREICGLQLHRRDLRDLPPNENECEMLLRDVSYVGKRDISTERYVGGIELYARIHN